MTLDADVLFSPHVPMEAGCGTSPPPSLPSVRRGLPCFLTMVWPIDRPCPCAYEVEKGSNISPIESEV
jgi:hypothetical protein